MFQCVAKTSQTTHHNFIFIINQQKEFLLFSVGKKIYSTLRKKLPVFCRSFFNLGLISYQPLILVGNIKIDD